MNVARAGTDIALWVLAQVEALPPDANGALVFGAPTAMSGAVLVQHGRVCWAAGAGLRRRLTDLLRAACLPSVSREEMEALFERCRAEHRPLGETLVEQGRIDPGALREALLHHTAEALTAAHLWAAAPRFVPHRAQGYAPAFTFQPAELLASASALACTAERLQAALTALSTAAGGRTAAVFDQPGEVLVAAQFQDATPRSVRSLQAAGTWAAASLAGTTSTVKFAFDGEGVWLGWRTTHTVLVRCADRADFSSAVRALVAHGLTSAVKSDVPFPQHLQ